ncbi:MAG: hypothetical protein NVV59_09185 [Chitinophagaceae bacterium]|nr:hypothetical protein [Chitinophagaceae bacterium]
MKLTIYNELLEKKRKGQKSFAVLIDPDKVTTSVLDELIALSIEARVDYFLVGGSLVISNHLDEVVLHIKKNVKYRLFFSPAAPHRSPDMQTPYFIYR